MLIGCSADYGSALAIELRRAPPPDAREFLRFKFRNGTDEEFRTIHVFGHRDDIPLTEFIYRLEVFHLLLSAGEDMTKLLLPQNSVIHNNEQWARACGIENDFSWPTLPGAAEKLAGSRFLEGTFAMAVVFLLMMFVWVGSFAVKRFRRRNYIRLHGEEVGSLCSFEPKDNV